MTPQASSRSSAPPVSPQAPTESRPAASVDAARSKTYSVGQTPQVAPFGVVAKVAAMRSRTTDTPDLIWDGFQEQPHSD
jgi:hypothetical protein